MFLKFVVKSLNIEKLLVTLNINDYFVRYYINKFTICIHLNTWIFMTNIMISVII